MVRKIHPAENLPPEEVDELLSFDPLDTAHKSEVLEARGDTVFSMDLDKYLAIVKDLGFEQILDVPFEPDNGKNEREEHLYIFWRRGLLLMFDTWRGDHVNGGKLYFNWAPTDQNEHVPSSGGYTKDAKGKSVIYGDFDCREALRHHISFLEARGKILEQWIKQPHLWPLHYGDTAQLDERKVGWQKKSDEYDRIRKERLAMLPEYVRKAILAKEGEDA